MRIDDATSQQQTGAMHMQEMNHTRKTWTVLVLCMLMLSLVSSKTGAMYMQELDKGERKEAEKEEQREDMMWRVNTEVHDPDIGMVSIPTYTLAVHHNHFAYTTGGFEYARVWCCQQRAQLSSAAQALKDVVVFIKADNNI